MDAIINFSFHVLKAAWDLLLDSSTYIVFGLLVSGGLRVFLSPRSVARHLSNGPVKSVIKSATLGIPIPLCSCGVLPAAVSLKKQGANSGATTAFLISTPESGVDSIAISYALLDPLMTVARPISAFVTAIFAGITENLFVKETENREIVPDLTCPVDACCDGVDCDPAAHSHHHSLQEKIRAGLRFAFRDVWTDMVWWFFLGLLLAGLITGLIPQGLLARYLGGGVYSMLIMLVIGIPIYICATASTPIAAAMILKGVSPGAALVFLLAGPATNITSLTVLFGILGKRAIAIYLFMLSGMSVMLGLALDYLYNLFHMSPYASIGKAAEIVPMWAQVGATAFLIAISIKPMWQTVAKKISRKYRTSHTWEAREHEDQNESKEIIKCAGST